MRYTNILSLALILSAVPGTEAFAQSDQPMMDKSQTGMSLESPFDRTMCASDGVAVGGLDLISYHHADGPIPGNEDFSMALDGSTYLFADQANLAMFRKDPERYLPEYAGLCAITLALGRITCPDFSNFKIEDSRLLLFEVTGFTNGRTLWDTNPTDFRKQADVNFEKLNNSE